MVNDEWLKTKLREQEIRNWTSKFGNAAGNKDEWKKVHHSYLQSNIWSELRKKALARANSRCESCRVLVVNDSLLDVHHRTYDRIGGNEKLEDLDVLCYSCHQKADKQRDRRTDERRQNNHYQRRLDRFGSNKYGPGWRYDKDEQEVEVEFILYLYKLYCKENDIDFDPRLDPDLDFDFVEFWYSVLDGDN